MRTEINAQNIAAVLNEFIAENLRNNGRDVRKAVSDAMRALKDQIERSPPIVFMPWSCPACGTAQPMHQPQCLSCTCEAPHQVRQPLRVQFTEETYEALCQNIQSGLDRLEQERERGAVPIGNGMYVETMADDEFADGMKKAGLA